MTTIKQNELDNFNLIIVSSSRLTDSRFVDIRRDTEHYERHRYHVGPLTQL